MGIVSRHDHGFVRALVCALSLAIVHGGLCIRTLFGLVDSFIDTAT
jgi:hypothetical protein